VGGSVWGCKIACFGGTIRVFFNMYVVLPQN